MQSPGQRINWIFLRLFVIKYISDYRNITIKESGRPVQLFRPVRHFDEFGFVFRGGGAAAVIDKRTKVSSGCVDLTLPAVCVAATHSTIGNDNSCC